MLSVMASVTNSASNLGITVVEKAVRAEWILRNSIGMEPASHESTVGGRTVRFETPTKDEYVRADCAMREAQLLEWWLERIEPSDVVWDIGAAVGTYAVFAADRADTIVAFEPHAGNARTLRDNLELNALEADIRRVALSDSGGTVPFAESEGNSVGLHRISNDGTTTVPSARGDRIEPAPDVLKIDVEGHELQVMEGMSDHLCETRVALVECHPDRGVDVDAVRTSLELSGLTVVELSSPRSETYLGAVRQMN